MAELTFEEKERADRISAAVEAHLKFRYGWIGLITAALIGGGAYTAFTALTSSIRSELDRAKNVVENAEQQLSEIQRAARAANEDLAKRQAEIEDLEKKSKQIDDDLDRVSAESENARTNLKDSITLVSNAVDTIKTFINQAEHPTSATFAQVKQSLEHVTAQATQAANRIDKGQYTLYIHSGGAVALGADLVARIQAGLAGLGYVVAGVDAETDQAGGPGVDYFYEQDERGATEIADFINSTLPHGATPLKPRLQTKFRNRPGTMGVWL